MKSAHSVICDFVLARAPEVGARERANLYRAVAQLIGNETSAAQLIELSNELDAIEVKHRQMVLDFKKRAEE